MELASIEVGQLIRGIAPSGPVRIINVTHHGDSAATVYYESTSGMGKLMALPINAAAFEVVPETGRPFDAAPEDFRLASEALRIREAAKYDPFLSVSTSNIRPLPHQLKAVYEEMLPRIPLRFLLADDPGAGKTIMAGLYIKQLILRDDVRRCLIVAPGGLVEQWQDELYFKFGLNFTILSGDLVQGTLGGSVFEQHDHLIVRMDQLSRNEELFDQARQSNWDLVIVDEAHRMGAHYFGKETKKTKRFQLGEMLRDRTRHLLLMTATPHAGKEEDFQLFLSLLDPDTFAGKPRAGVTRSNPSAFMRRMVKEELQTLEGKPLFPLRVANTVRYQLSEDEQYLYERVSDYVRTEMNRADKLDGKRKNTVGFALTVLQRRLASSPEAIFQSLTRRTARLQARREDLVNGRVVAEPVLDPMALADDEEFPSAEFEESVEEVLDAATSARTVAELDTELASLAELTELARRLRASGRDVKWQQLSSVIQDDVLVAADRPRKLIIFTEHRDTLEYLRHKVATLTGSPDAVVAIHGGVNRKERRRVTAEFTHNADVQFLIATDAAGEGLNLQAAHLMVNYDLPWNPNRIEQRFGRIHRIGQEEVCCLWNLVATNTREGDVYSTLLHKLDQMRESYGGKVFDVLGEAFDDGRSLRDLLVEAIRFGDDPAVRAKMQETVNAQAGEGLRELIEQHDLAYDKMTDDDVATLRRQFEDAYAKRLAPHFIEAAFADAFMRLGGRWSARERGRYEITHVPQALRANELPIATRYFRVTFDPGLVEVEGAERADLLAPGHPLLDEVLRLALDRWGHSLHHGTVLVSDVLTEPRLLVGLAQEMSDGLGEVVDRRFQYLLVDAAGVVTDAGPAPHLDLVGDPGRLADADGLTWLAAAEDHALGHAVTNTMPQQLAELEPARRAQMDRLWEAVYHRLTHEIERLGVDSLLAAEREARGETVKESSLSLERQADELRSRRGQREQQILAQRLIVPAPPRLVSVALVVPAGDALAAAAVVKETKRVERRAVEAVMAAERALGRRPVEQPFNNPGFDILSEVDGEPPIYLEVKGRISGAEDFVITRNEVLHAKNTAERYRLALVEVHPEDPECDDVTYVLNPFDGVAFGDFSTAKLTLPWQETRAKGGTPR